MPRSWDDEKQLFGENGKYAKMLRDFLCLVMMIAVFPVDEREDLKLGLEYAQIYPF